jgi:hypothetical protein
MLFIGALLLTALVLTASTTVLACCTMAGRLGDRVPLPKPVPLGSELEQEIA